jgi:hypothetical protein
MVLEMHPASSDVVSPTKSGQKQLHQVFQINNPKNVMKLNNFRLY